MTALLEATGMALGAMCILFSTLLGFRPEIEPHLPARFQAEERFAYDWKVWAAWFAAGAVIITSTNAISVRGVITSDEFALLAQVFGYLMALLFFVWLWFDYPDAHPLLGSVGGRNRPTALRRFAAWIGSQVRRLVDRIAPGELTTTDDHSP